MISKLASGLRVCTRPMAGVETATVTLLAECGSRHEPEAINGIAHLFEHMVFKGAGARSAREISEAIEDVGGELNACTERDATSFTASVMAEHVPLGIELLADMIIRPHLADDEIEREKQVVLQELAEACDTPSDIIFDELWAAAFADQPLGRSILGSETSIDRITGADLRMWRDSHFRGDGMILVAAGKVRHEEIVALAERHLGQLGTGGGPAAPKAKFEGAARMIRSRSAQAHVALAFEGPAVAAKDQLPARLFADIVGGGASSRLFQELREERGLAYSVSAALQSYRDGGLLYVHAATARRDGSAAMQLIRQSLIRAAGDVSQRELDRARNQAKAGLLMHLETSWGQASFAARQLSTYGRIKAPAELAAELDQVTLDEVRSAGAAMLARAPALATIGLPAVRAA